jgi:hypothetical protein
MYEGVGIRDIRKMVIMVIEFSSLHAEFFARFLEFCRNLDGVFNFCITHSIFSHGKWRGFSAVSVIDGICCEIL